MSPRVGLGVDLHPWGADGELRLGGVVFPGLPALRGHSDGDVVCHAVADALLGAAALGDLGDHAPETDPAFAGIAGPELLGRIVAVVARAGFRPGGCDATVIAERPAIAPHREAIRTNLAAVLDLPLDRVSVKATRPEGLGLTGEGVGCLAVVVLA